MRTLKSIASLLSVLFLLVAPALRGQKAPLTLDDFFNSVEIRSVQISPDGHDVVIETCRPDWTSNRFSNDLWLYRNANGGGSIGGWMWGGTDERESIRTIHAVLDKGINLIDTAPVYGFGVSEEIVGKAIGRMPPLHLSVV